MTNGLEQRQKAGELLERDMIEFMLQFSPCSELKVCDVKMIAFKARHYAFELFTKADEAA